MWNMSTSDNEDGVMVMLETGSSYNFRQEQDICKFPKTKHVFSELQIAMNIDIKKPCQQQIQASCP